MTGGLVRAGLGLALVAAAVGSARADSDDSLDPDESGPAGEPVGVLEVATYGVSATAGDKFEESVEETLSEVGRRVIRSNTVQERLAGGNYVVGCTFGPCLREVYRRTQLRRVLVARIHGAGQSYNVVVSLVDTRTGYLLSQVAQSCPVCTVEEAIRTASRAVVELVGSDANKQAGRRRVAGAGIERGGSGGDGGRVATSKRGANRIGWALVASGVVAGGVGAALAADDRDFGGPLVGGGIGLAASGLAVLVLATTF